MNYVDNDIYAYRELYYVPSSAPKLTPRAYLKRVNTTQLNETLQRWHFQASGNVCIEIIYTHKEQDLLVDQDTEILCQMLLIWVLLH
jgi:hypothetical protein